MAELASKQKIHHNIFCAASSKEMVMTHKNTYCVYIMTNQYHTVLYTGVTNDLPRRVFEHRSGQSTFTKMYKATKLVYFEIGSDVNAAIAREKQIKAGSRQKKIDLINTMNPEWRDLYEDLV
jgi:putative endonuclease